MIHAIRRRLRELVRTRIGPAFAGRHPARVDLPLSTWGLSVGSTGTIWSGGVDLEAVAREHGPSVHVVRTEALARNAAAALGTGTSVPHADAFYSYKTNPVPAVLRRLHDAGIGAEVTSPFELWLAERLGVPGERIVYNGPGKSDDTLRRAIELGTLMINANSLGELSRIAKVAAELGRPANVGIRVALPGAWAGQFGVRHDHPGLFAAITDASSDPLLDLRGIHVHRGGAIETPDGLQAHVAAALDWCDVARRRTGWHPEIIDIGGSVACPTVASIPARQYRLNRAFGVDLLPPEPAARLHIGAASALAARLVSEHSAEHGLATPRVIQEPGRALTSDAQLLLTTVLEVKDDAALHHAVLDVGFVSAEPVQTEYHQLFSVSAPTAHASAPYRLVGPVCTPADVLYNHWRLPELEPGHVLAIMDSGAYFVPQAGTFSFPRLPIVVQEGDTISISRRAETFADVVAYDRLD